MVQSLAVPRSILILGGTSESRELASLLVEAGHHVTTSLAGRTTAPAIPQGKLRVGGFGGAAGIVNYIRDNDIDLIADATHPFAQNISRHAFDAASAYGIEYLRLERPPWTPRAGEKWVLVKNSSQAAAVISSGARVLVTIGRKEISPFLERQDLGGVVRMIEKPDSEIPQHWHLHQARPPFTVAEETEFMRRQNIEWLVTKNAGGQSTFAKMIAASALGIKIVVIDRPEKPRARTAPTARALVELIE